MSDHRYRCASCGNVTRFDVTATRRTRAFHHYELGGDLRVREEILEAETIEAVVCRWCGTGENVGVVPAASARPVTGD